MHSPFPYKEAALGLALTILVACGRTPEATLQVTPPPTDAPCVASIQVDADPPETNIYLDGQLAGHSPAELSVASGPHQVELQAMGYATYRASVDVACGEVEALRPKLYDIQSPVVTMDPVPAVVSPDAGLKVTAFGSDNHAVSSMALYVDDDLIYQIEAERLRHNVDTRVLAPGMHTVRIVARDATGNTTEAPYTFEVVPPTPAILAEAQPGATPSVVVPALTAAPVATAAPTPSPLPTALPAVAVFEDQITLTLYDYVPALYTDPEGAGHPYPLLNPDLVGEPIRQVFQTVVLQNRYLEVVILPELGGRIYQCRFLPTGQPLLYNSRVAKPTRWGPPEQGWWLALGGIEFALPVEEHGYLTAQPWDATVTRQADGSATVMLQAREVTRGLDVRVEITLHPGEAAIRQHTTIGNTSGADQRFQYWTNAMLSPGRHGVGPELAITFPADHVVVHSRGDESLPVEGAAMTWPVYAGRDLSAYAEWRNWLGFFGPSRWAPFMAIYDGATQIGMVHVDEQAMLPGAKVFGFGSGFDDSAYSDDGAQYIELWSGLTRTFSQNTFLPAGASVGWHETWYVVAQSGGVTFANKEASLYAWREGDVVRMTIASYAEHRWRLLASQNGQVIADQIFDVRPDTPFRATVKPAEGAADAPVDIRIVDLSGSLVLEYGY